MGHVGTKAVRGSIGETGGALEKGKSSGVLDRLVGVDFCGHCLNGGKR